jgi:hypothetical protein
MDREKLLEKFEFFKTIAVRLQYNIHPIATEDEVAFFENKFNVRLPVDFRWFVLNVANGIINASFHDPIIKKIDFTNYFYEEDEYNPSLPFTPTQRVVWGSSEGDSVATNFTQPTTYYDLDDDFWEGAHNGYIDIDGTTLLIVNGKEYGNLWRDNYSSMQEIYPIRDNGKNLDRVTFEQLIHTKLDRVIQEYHPRSNRSYPKPAYTYPSQPRHNDYVVTNVKTPETTWTKVMRMIGFK